MRRLWYNLKITFKNKELIFWTFAFPIILGTFFYMAFSGIKTAQDFEPIKIAVVENEKNQLYPVYHQIIDGLSEPESENRVFETKYVKNQDEVTAELDEKKIEGIITFSDNDFPKLTIKESGMNQTILQNVFTEIEQSIMLGKQLEYSEIKNTYAPRYEYIMIEYFSLMAMACLYGAMISTKALDKNLANMAASGKRIAVAAISKAKIIVTVLVTSYITQLIGLALLFAYLTVILGIDFGGDLPVIIGFTCVAALLSLSLGIFISVIFKVSENTKDGITSGFTMFGAFFAGMMGPEMKYVIDLNLPIINKLNPTAIITDGYYALVNYGMNERFWTSVISILIYAAVLSSVSIMVLRRQKYDNL